MGEPILSTSKKRKPMHFSVGAVIEQRGKYLMLDRKNPPYGWACVAGHVDEGEMHDHALIREVREEAGLQVTRYNLLFVEELEESCKDGIPFHYWHLYSCSVKGTVKNNGEAKEMRWFSPAEIKELHAAGKLEWVWEYWFTKLGIL